MEDPNRQRLVHAGRKVVVYTGILPITQNEAGLAVVMGHEIAHAFAKHGAERMTQGLLVDFGGMALSKALETKPTQTKDLFMLSYGLGTQVGVLLPYSRLHENEADRLGLIFMAMAGYNPNEAVAFWQRMAAGKKGAAATGVFEHAPSRRDPNPEPQRPYPRSYAILPQAVSIRAQMRGQHNTKGGDKSTLIVYFDTNAFRDFAESRHGATGQKIALLRKRISEEKLVIAPSFEVFEELVSVLKLDAEGSKRFCHLYDNLADWEYSLKPMDEILANDITSFAYTGKAACPFNPIDESSPFIQSIRANEYVLPLDLLKDLIDKESHQKNTFVRNVLNISERFKPKSGTKASQKKDYEQEFRSFWEPRGYAENLAEMLVRDNRELNKIRARGLAEFLMLPTIRLAVGYILHSKYKQVADGAIPEESDAYDFRHAVIAGAVGNIVTNDNKLRNAIHHIPGHNVRIWSLEEFITQLS